MSQIKTKTSWDLSPLFSSLDDPKMLEEIKIVTEVIDIFSKKWRADESYMTNISTLRIALDELEEIDRNYGIEGKQGYYIGLLHALDQNNDKINSALGRIEKWEIDNYNKIHFFMLQLGKISPEKQQEFLAAPELLQYKHALQKVFENAKYNLPEREEEILTLVSPQAAGNWVKLTQKLLSSATAKVSEDGKKLTKTADQLIDLCRGMNKQLRDEAGHKLAKLLKKQMPIAEAEMNSLLGHSSVIRKLRNVKRPDEMRHVSDDIESSVVDAMIKAVSAHNDIAHRYYALKAKLLKQQKLEYYERGVEFPVASEEKYTFEEAVNSVHKVFSDLDSEFAEIFKMFAETGKIDAFPKKGKQGGAFCAHDLITEPTYILMNFNGSRNDIRTLAHEAGHGINNELMRKAQPPIYFGTSLATAEVASTFMEDFMSVRLFDTATKEQRLLLLMNKLNDEIATVFRQVACYRFELDLHNAFEEKRFLSQKEIAKMFKKRMEEYMGPSISQKVGGESFWVIWSHIRNSFYVYSYASGLLISKALQRVVKQDKKAISNVKQFLAAGESKSPKEIFADIGIDITDETFWLKGIREIEDTLKEAESLL